MDQLNFRIVLRNDSSINWSLNESTVLLRGEVGVEFFDDGKVKIKIGDGVTPWSSLKYFGGEVVGDKKSIDIINETLQLVGFDSAEVNSYPVKGEDGTINWVLNNTVSTEEFEALKSRVQKVETDIVDLTNVIGSDATGETTATGLFAIINKKADADTVYTRPEIDALLGSVYKYRGSKPTYNDLPTEGMTVGDVWNIEIDDADHGIKAGDNVAWNGTAWDRLAGAVDLTGYITTEQFAPIKSAVEEFPSLYLTQKKAEAVFEKVKYEVSNKPVGTLVDYRDKEIRVMCPANTAWIHQTVGSTGNSNMYYIGFKAYAPSDDVVSFKEDDKATIEDQTMYYFENNSFAGIDNYGRKYSIVWLAVARYDEETQTWSYYGENSSYKKYVGWYYSVEWYNADGIKVGSDCIRINLTNENCHDSVEPFYMNNVVKGIKFNGTLLDVIDGITEINIDVPSIKSSTEENKVSIAEDGTLEVNSLNVNKLTQTEGEWIILNGGSSAI